MRSFVKKGAYGQFLMNQPKRPKINHQSTLKPYIKKYDTHVPTTFLQKNLLLGGSTLLSILNPTRGDMVATTGETLPFTTTALNYMRLKMRQDEEGRDILKRRPRINEVLNERFKYEQLEKEFEDRENTVGYRYLRFMRDRGFKASERSPVRFVDKDEELAYVMLRYREIHDFTHVLSELDVTILGELAVKWFEFTQNKLPMNLMSGVFGYIPLLNYSEGNKKQKEWETQTYRRVLIPWAVQNAINSKFLMTVDFEKYLDRDIDEFREQIRFKKAPVLKNDFGVSHNIVYNN